MDKKRLGIYIALGILTATVILFVFLFFQQKKENNEFLQLYELEKEEMENEFERFAVQYDELQMTISNDSLFGLLEQEKMRSQRLLEELRMVKSGNAQEIARLKKELNTVRAVLRTYIVQIDSLNRVNEALEKENKEVKQRYSEASRRITNLSEEKKSLTKQVTLASQLDATNIAVAPKNKRGKNVKKVKDVMQLNISFTIVKNITAPTGNRALYIRIVKPDNDVLTKNPSHTFAYENRTLGYSIQKMIEYTGEEQDVIVYWHVEEFMHPGNYRVEIFSDGTMIGSQRFTLD